MENRRNDALINRYINSLNSSRVPTIVIFRSLQGDPEFIFNRNEVNKYFDGLKMEQGRYFLNTIRLRQFKFRKNLAQINRPFIQRP